MQSPAREAPSLSAIQVLFSLKIGDPDLFWTKISFGRLVKAMASFEACEMNGPLSIEFSRQEYWSG